MRWLRLLIVLIVCGLAGGAGGVLVGLLSAQGPIAALERYDPPQVTRLYDRTGRNRVADFYSEKRHVVALADMPSDLRNAFVAIEDERFYEHFGADPIGILRAILKNLQAGRLREGGSTITQQMTRNVLPQVTTDRTLKRKIREAFLALQIEGRYSKDQILEFYLNQIFLGHRSYGVQAAAQTYFGKDAIDLNLAECASLAAIPKSPTTVNPFSNPEKLLARRNLVINNMLKQQRITEEEAQQALATTLATVRSSRPRVRHPYFVDHLRRELSDDPQVGEDLASRGGYRIYSTIDMEWQTILEEEILMGLLNAERMWQDVKPQRREDQREELNKSVGTDRPQPGQVRLAEIEAVKPDGLDVRIDGYRGTVAFPASENPDRPHPYYFDPDWILRAGHLVDVKIDEVNDYDNRMKLSWYDAKHIQGAAVLLDVKTGQIRALVGGSEFYDMQNAGMWNRATRVGRQPGSAFKPLLYGVAFDQGYTPGSVLMDDRFEQGGYVPRNYSGYYGGPTTLYQALVTSNNVVTVKLMKALGFNVARRGYRQFNIVPPRWDLPPELPLCLGSLNTSPLSIAAAYRAFAWRGLAIEPVSFRRIDTTAGRLVRRAKPAERSVISEESAYLVTNTLVETVDSGTGRVVGNYFDDLDIPVPQIAGKTGTTSDCVDAWFVGYTPDVVLVVWVGFDRVRPMGPGMTGSHVAAPIWKSMYERVLRSRSDWKMTFDVPSSIVFKDISDETGLLKPLIGSNMGERILSDVPFRKGTEPREESQGYDQFPYWEYQHPVSQPGDISGPDAVPERLLLRWKSRREERRTNIDIIPPTLH